MNACVVDGRPTELLVCFLTDPAYVLEPVCLECQVWAEGYGAMPQRSTLLD